MKSNGRAGLRQFHEAAGKFDTKKRASMFELDSLRQGGRPNEREGWSIADDRFHHSTESHPV